VAKEPLQLPDDSEDLVAPLALVVRRAGGRLLPGFNVVGPRQKIVGIERRVESDPDMMRLSGERGYSLDSGYPNL
jgi:hypothetical protein